MLCARVRGPLLACVLATLGGGPKFSLESQYLTKKWIETLLGAAGTSPVSMLSNAHTRDFSRYNRMTRDGVAAVQSPQVVLAYQPAAARKMFGVERTDGGLSDAAVQQSTSTTKKKERREDSWSNTKNNSIWQYMRGVDGCVCAPKQRILLASAPCR